ncbi:FUSC family protein [Enterococcus faecalis]|nr:FUSC family protein [Enterococcus faecalis]
MGKRNEIVYLIGAIISTSLSIYQGYITHNNLCIVYSVLGAFSYSFFSAHSLRKSIKNILLHGMSLVLVFNFGICIYFIPWLIPFAFALIFLVCYLITEFFTVPNPKYFYILLLFTVGLKGINKFELNNLVKLNIYLSYGIGFSIISAILIGILFSIPWNDQIRCRTKHNSKDSLTDKIYKKIHCKPQLLVIAVHGAFTFFVIGYVIFLLNINDSVWIAVSCTAVISADEIFLIKKKFKQRIIGSILGISLGYLILILELDLLSLLLILLIMNALFELYMKKNYLIANIFTNPLVLILAQFSTSGSILEITIHRFVYLVLGALIGYCSMLIFYSSLDHLYLYK